MNADTLKALQTAWPYEIPKNWRWTTVGAINQYKGMIVRPDRTPGQRFELYSVPSSASGAPEIVKGAGIGSVKKTVERDDILLCKINPRINRVWRVLQKTQYPLLASGEWMVIRNRRLCAAYLMWYFRSPQFRQIMCAHLSGVGGSLLRAQPKWIRTYPVPLPPAAEQQRIAARIEQLFSRLDAAEQKIQESIDGLEIRRASLFHSALTGDLSAQWRRAHGDGDWSCVHLGALLLPTERRKPDGETFRYIDIDAIDHRWQTVRAPKLLLTRKAPSRAAQAVAAGDTLFSLVRPYLKNIALIDTELSGCTASTGFFVCRPSERILPRFLYYLLCAPETIDYLNQFMKGDNSPSIQKEDLLGLPVRLPPAEEQAELIRLLDLAFARERQVQVCAEAALEQIRQLRQIILFRAFRGELGTNDPGEDGGDRLLESILADPAE